MAEFLGPLLNFIGGEQAPVKIAVTLLILVLGHIGVKLARTAARKHWIDQEELNRKQIADRHEAIRDSGYVLDAGVISLALIYLNNSFTDAFFSQVVEFIPRLLSAALVGILGIIAIRLLTKLTENFMKTAGAPGYLREIGLSGSAVKVIAGLFKGFLYLVLLQVALTQLGVGDTFVRELVHASSWAAAFLIAGLLFYGFKDLFQNFAAGIYLKNSRFIRPGEEVKLEGEDTEVRDISLFSTSLDTNSGRTIISPNRKIMESDISFKRTKSDLETLEDIRNYFSAETPEYSGPASVQMALEVLGYRLSSQDVTDETGEQEDIGSEELVEAIEKLTDGEVRAAFVEEDKITGLAPEFKTWFNDGALVIPEFNKQIVFPDSGGSRYALSAGVEGSEILIADPETEKGGGVYYVSQEKLEDAMRQLDGRKGYIVLAPEGTTAHWRIKNDLLYSDRDLYDELSKTLEARLTKIMRQGRIMKDVMPESISNYLEKWRTSGDATRLWSPEQE